MISLGIRDDYAAVSVEAGIKFYYGYEKTVDDGEWCFVASSQYGTELCRLSKSNLIKKCGDLNQRSEPHEFLLAGIASFYHTNHF